MYESSPISIVSPAPALEFNSSEEAIAYYHVHGVRNRQDIIILCNLIRKELGKINTILDDVVSQLEDSRKVG